MGWMQALCETYDNYFDGKPLDDPHPLVPVGFIEKEVNIRVNLSADGTFNSASVVTEGNRYPVPTTPMAEGRTGSSAVPYPLCEDLRYTAGDLSDYASDDYSTYAKAYADQLCRWSAEPDAPDSIKALNLYISQHTLIKDLVACGMLWVDENGKLIEKWSGRNDKPAIYKAGKDLDKCVVDFTVQQGDRFLPIREIPSVREHWRHMVSHLLPNSQLCYVDGEVEPTIYNHTKILGNAKLISAKDDAMSFQYKGRFLDAEQAYAVGYASSAKIHNTIRWLSSRQSFQRYGSTFMVWSTACRPVIMPKDDEEEGWGVPDEDECQPTVDAETYYAIRVRNVLAGCRSAPAYKKGAHIIMLGIEAASPGRASVNYYQELDGSEYLDRIEKWYTGCIWLLPGKKGDKTRSFVTTPTLREISEAVFSTDNVNTALHDKETKKSITKQIKSFRAGLLSCIANGLPIPQSAATAAFRRACQPMAFTKNSKWQRDDWLKCLAVTCAMEKSINKEGFNVALNTREDDTSYLFGRLVAVADCAEIWAMANSDSPHRQTNAIRYFCAIQQRPSTTWANVESRLLPYLARLGIKARKYTDLMDEIINLFKDGEMKKNNALTAYFLQGYHCQREALLNKKEKEQ